LVIEGGKLRGAKVHGHGDHRAVMALAIAGMAAEGQTEIDTAESAAVTFPAFAELMRSLGADLETAEDGTGT
jgi:3-phosphoshikimate 1-carboxyvinyltransferase